MHPAHDTTTRRRGHPPARWTRLLLLLGAFALAACSSELAVPTEPLRLLRADWGVAYVGEPFDAALRPAGGLRPYRFELADGTLPPGLLLTSGRVVGTPTEIGRFEFTITIQDGNLSQALQQLAIDVRPLPTPVIRIDTPATEVREALPLVVRLEDARAWRGGRIAIIWDPSAFALAAAPTAGDARLALLHEASEGRLLLEVAALGGARTGAATLARFTLQPLTPPARVGLQVTAASRYAGGDHVAVRNEGVRLARQITNPTAATPAGGARGATPEPAGEGDGGEAKEEVAP
jgi:hypothetical protein